MQPFDSTSQFLRDIFFLYLRRSPDTGLKTYERSGQCRDRLPLNFSNGLCQIDCGLDNFI